MPQPIHAANRRHSRGLPGLALLCLLGLHAAEFSPATPEPAPEPLRTRALTRGTNIVSQAGQSLGTVLLQAIRQGGVTNALPLCSVQAIPLTTSLAQANGVQLRRVSHRPRNPANQADETELGILQQFEAARKAGRKPTPQILATTTNQITFFAPILIPTNLCLQCHGDPAQDLPPDLPPLLNQLYPADQATGFRLGDLRGLWRIDFPLNTLSQ